MKRLLACLAAVAAVGSVIAQAPFTIVRPADGSKVRETVHVLFPKNSVPQGGYIGIFINGKFIEAVVPNAGAKFLDYPIDTKAMNLPDGPATIKAVLYMTFAEKPRIVDQSSVEVTISNKANIPTPDQGFRLRYVLPRGKELIYDWVQNATASQLSENEQKNGGHGAETPVTTTAGRMVYDIDDKYGDGDSLIRMQLEPPHGKDTMLVSLLNESTPRDVNTNELYPVYMRINETGEEIYGLVPIYFGFQGTPAPLDPLNVYAVKPFPRLPRNPVRPGDFWFTRFQIESPAVTNPAALVDRNSVVDKYPARGEFVDVEWEMGHPCAKIHNSFTAGGGAGSAAAGNSTNIDETFWFALDRGVVLKLIRTITEDRQDQTGQQGGMGGIGGGGMMTPPGPPKGGSLDNSDAISDKQTVGGSGKLGFGGGGRMTPGGGMRGPGMFGPGGGGNGGMFNPNQQTAANQVSHVQIVETFTLEL